MKLPNLSRVAVGLVFAFTALGPASCGKKAEETTAKVEQPNPPPPPKPKPPGGDPNPGPSGPGLDIGGLLNNTPPPGSPAEQSLLQKHKAALLGTWAADLGNGATEERTYNADGTYLAKLTGPTPASDNGKYTVQGLAGTKGLKIQLAGANAKTIRVTFEDNELHHPTLQPGVTGTFRKK